MTHFPIAHKVILIVLALANQPLTAQDVPSPEDKATKQTRTNEKASQASEQITIQLESPSNPALDSFHRRIADAIAANNGNVQIVAAGVTITNPKEFEAELWLKPDVAFEAVQRLMGALNECKISQIRFANPTDDRNRVIVIAPELGFDPFKDYGPINRVAMRDGFEFETKIRNNVQSKPPAPQGDIQSQITQLEVDLATKKLQLGEAHPEIQFLKIKLDTLRQIEREKSQLPVTVFRLKNAKCNSVAEKLRLMLPKEAGPIVSDERTNSVMVRGDVMLVKEVHRLIELLDEEVTPQNEDKMVELPNPLTVKVTVSELAGQRPELRPFLNDLHQLPLPDNDDKPSPIAAVLIKVPAELSRESWNKIVSSLVVTGGVREFFIDLLPEEKVTEIRIFVNSQGNESGKSTKDLESLEPIRKQLENLPNLNIKYIEFSGDIHGVDHFSESKTEPASQQVIKVFALRYISAEEAQKIIVELFGRDGAAVSAEQRTNTIVVRCAPELNDEIEAILVRLDEKPQGIPPPKKMERTNSSPNAQSNLSNEGPSSTVSTIEAFRVRLQDLEMPVLQLAEKLRSCEATLGKDHSDCVKLRADLRALVQQSFVARQEIQRAELVEFTRRLQVMQQTIEARDRISEKIVDRRIEELLDPNVEWSQPKSKQQTTYPSITFR